MRTQPDPTPDDKAARWPAILHPVALLAAMWLVEIFDRILPGQWERFGIRAWDLSSLPGVFLAPLLHSDWAHLIGNSMPLLILGVLVVLEGVRRFWLVTLLVAVLGAVGPLLLTSPGTVTVGASGLVFGHFAYVITRVFVAPSLGHRIGYALVAIVAGVLYGGAMLLGIFAAGPGVSWQGHLTGAIAGVVAAIVLRDRPRDPQPSSLRPDRA